VSISLTRTVAFVFLGVSLIGGAVVHSLWGFSSLILFAAGVALSGTISLMWASLSRMGQNEGMSFDEALSFNAPTATEEQKRAVLRTLKDLEYELHVGKISQEDFEEVSADVRKKAKHLIAEQDEDMDERMKQAEARVEKFKNSQEIPENFAKKGRGRQDLRAKNEAASEPETNSRQGTNPQEEEAKA
jgi:hypothetical protein